MRFLLKDSTSVTHKDSARIDQDRSSLSSSSYNPQYLLSRKPSLNWSPTNTLQTPSYRPPSNKFPSVFTHQENAKILPNVHSKGLQRHTQCDESSIHRDHPRVIQSTSFLSNEVFTQGQHQRHTQGQRQDRSGQIESVIFLI